LTQTVQNIKSKARHYFLVLKLTFLKRIHGGYASGMRKFKIVRFGFSLDVLKGRVHFEGFRDRLASFWAKIVLT
jgi:hypothetical protein